MRVSPLIRRRALLVLGAALALVLAGSVARWLGLAWQALRYPWGLDYGEGIVWQQMRMMLAGHGYAPLQPYPAIVFHYPPLFHMLAAAMAGATGMDQLIAGRLVAILSTAAAAGALGAIAAQITGPARGSWPPRIAGLAAAAILTTVTPVLEWSVLFRVDMPSLALSLAGMALAIRAIERPRWIHGAALCFVAALYAKQTALAAPAAAFGVLLLLHPRTAFAGLATSIATGTVVLVAIGAATHGEFLHHIILYNVNRLCLGCARDIGEAALNNMGFGLVALASLVLRLWRLHRAGRPAGLLPHLRANPRDAALAMAILYLALATLMLAMALKSGASINYFLEWTVLLGLFDGLLLADVVAAGIPALVALLVPLAIGGQAIGLLFFYDPDDVADPGNAATMAHLAQAVAQAPGPVISDDMVLLLRGHKQVVLEPSIFAELTERDTLEDAPVLDRIEDHAFAMFLTEHGPGDEVFESRYNPDMVAEMKQAYPQRLLLSNGYVAWLPAGPIPDWAEPLTEELAD